MQNRKKVSIFDRTCDRVFSWAAGRLISALPVIGPIYTVLTLVNEVASIEKELLK